MFFLVGYLFKRLLAAEEGKRRQFACCTVPFVCSLVLGEFGWVQSAWCLALDSLVACWLLLEA